MWAAETDFHRCQERESRYRPVWPRRPPPPHRFPSPYARPIDMPPFMKPPDMGGMGIGVNGVMPPFRVPPRLPMPELTTPHAAPVAPRPLRRPVPTPLYQDFSAPSRPTPITITTQTSATKCQIDWKPPALSKPVKYTYKLEVWEGVQCDTYELPGHTMSYKIKTTPGAWYKIELNCVDSSGNVLAMGWTRMKAVFSHEEMQQLYKKSLDFVGSMMHSFRFLYRCKPKPYYDDIQFRCAGIMEKYLKDNNGQAASSINGAISGLFFSARLLPDGTLPAHSPFGNVRMLVPAMTLLDPNRINMYFCDFYCNYITHYVTVVICEKRSDTDAFCSQHLIKLVPESNPFLRINFRPPMFEPEFWVNKNVWVEIYYTENVPLSWGRFDTIIATGAGTSRIGGLPHNKQCNICNLHPQRASSQKVLVKSKVNSTFDLLLSLEEKRLGAEVADESADIIETICSLVDSVVEQSADSNPQSNEATKGNTIPQKVCEPIADVIRKFESKLQTEDMKRFCMLLKDTVESLDRRLEKTESLLLEIKIAAENMSTVGLMQDGEKTLRRDICAASTVLL